MADGRRVPRSGQFTNINNAASRSVAFGVDGFVTVNVAPPICYSAQDPDSHEFTGEALFLTAEVAAAQSEPNGSAPASNLIMPVSTYRSGRIGILAVWPGTAQTVTFNVWVRTGLTATGLPKWALVVAGASLNPATCVEYIADVGGRDVFVQVLTGADSGHHVQFAMGVV